MRIAFAVPDLADPPMKGYQVRARQFVEHLSRSNEVEVAVLRSRGMSASALPALLSNVVSAARGGFPLQSALFDRDANGAFARRADVVVVVTERMPRLTLDLSARSAPVVLDVVDALERNMAQRASASPRPVAAVWRREADAFRRTAQRLRALKPGFLVLHYRLGIGDGPVPFRIGDRWASDYRQVARHESWFWHEHGRRVFQRQWRWYLMNPSSGWRAYWARRVLHEARLLADDGYALLGATPLAIAPSS
jgi:hypothetical protein